jgi:uncharacterized protein
MINLYDVSIPPLIHALNNLAANLAVGEAFANTKQIEPSVLLQSRLIADMYPLIKQVQIATDMSKGAAARLAGLEIPQYEDNETSFEELQARINKTVVFLSSITAEQIEGAETRPVSITVRKVELQFNGLDYLNEWVLPNVYFHCTTAYNIMRDNGVDLGKKEFLRLKHFSLSK